MSDLKTFFISFEHVMMFIGKIILVVTAILTIFLIGYVTNMVHFAQHVPEITRQYFQFYISGGELPADFDAMPILRNVWAYTKDLLAIGASCAFILFMSSAIMLAFEHFKLGRKTVRTSAEQKRTLRMLVYTLLLLSVIKASRFLGSALSDIITTIELQAIQMI